MKIPRLLPAAARTGCLLLAALSLAMSCAAIPTKESYREVAVVQHTAWLLTTTGKIEVYDAQGHYQPLPPIETVVAQHIATDGTTVVAQLGNSLQRWNSATAAWQVIGKVSTPTFGIVVNRRHQVFAITPKGVLDVSTGKTHFPRSSPNHQLLKFNSFEQPATYFIDNQDTIWLGFGYGEWGGNIFAYSTINQRFTELKFNDFNIELNPVKSFFQLQDGVGVSAGLQHFNTSGTIAAFTNASARVIYNTRTKPDTTGKRPAQRSEQPYIGPAAYDAQANKIYFYSQLGVYEATYGSNLSELANWTKLFEPKLHWQSGQRDAIGSPMNVLQMLAFGEGKLVLLTQNDGAVLWTGRALEQLAH